MYVSTFGAASNTNYTAILRITDWLIDNHFYGSNRVCFNCSTFYFIERG